MRRGLAVIVGVAVATYLVQVAPAGVTPADALFWSSIKKAARRVASGAKRLFKKGKKAVKKAARKVSRGAKRLFNKGKRAVKRAVKKVTHAWNRIKEQVVKGVRKGITFVRTTFRTAKQLWNEVKNLRFPLVRRWKKRHKRTDLRSKFLRTYGIKIKDQYYSTCMAHAMSTGMEYQLIRHLLNKKYARVARKYFGKRGPRGMRVSRKMIYWYSRKGLQVCSSKGNPAMMGSWAANAARHLQQQGVSDEKYWPFTWWDPTNKKKYKSCMAAATDGNPSRSALANRKFFIDKWYYLPALPLPGKASVRRASDIAAIIGQGLPVVVTVFTFKSGWARNGHVKTPRFQMPKSAHYILLVGYDDAKKVFIFANSWGPKWGDKGFGYLPYKYVERYAIEGVVIRSVKVR